MIFNFLNFKRFLVVFFLFFSMFGVVYGDEATLVIGGEKVTFEDKGWINVKNQVMVVYEDGEWTMNGNHADRDLVENYLNIQYNADLPLKIRTSSKETVEYFQKEVENPITPPIPPTTTPVIIRNEESAASEGAIRSQEIHFQNIIESGQIDQQALIMLGNQCMDNQDLCESEFDENKIRIKASQEGINIDYTDPSTFTVELEYKDGRFKRLTTIQNSVDNNNILLERQKFRDGTYDGLRINDNSNQDSIIAAYLEGVEIIGEHNLEKRLSDINDIQILTEIRRKAEGKDDGVLNSVDEQLREISSNLNLNDDQRKLLMETGNQDIIKNVVNNVDDTSAFCNSNEVACLTYLDGTNLNTALGKSISQKALLECYGDDVCRRNVEDNTIVTESISNSCTGFFNSITFCSARKQVALNEAYKESLRQSFRSVENQNKQTKVNLGDGEFNCGGSVNECLNQLQTHCEGDKNCITQGTRAINANSFWTKQSLEKYNNEIAKNTFLGIDAMEDCTENCVQQAKDYCSGDGNGKTECRVGLKELEQNEMVEVGMLYSVVQAILNPDQNALKAARLFGFEANYDYVPALLKEPFASQMCLAKIDGYLDKEIENAGGITKYSDDKNNLEVLGDIRAQRTRITPDNKTMITYSAFVNSVVRKDPNLEEATSTSVDLKYMVGISYRKNGELVKDQLSQIISVNSGKSDSRFDSVNFPINATEDQVENFVIHLVVVDANNQPKFTLTYPIILIEGGDYYHTIVRGEGNKQGNEQAKKTMGEGQREEDLFFNLF